MKPRVAVIVPCLDAGRLVLETVASLAESEPLEVVVVDDASQDAETLDALAELEAGGGVQVLRRATTGGAARSRTDGLHATVAPLVFPLDADDLALPGRIARAANRLDAEPGAAACVGDYEEFGERGSIVRAVPEALDPYRVAFTNEYANTSLFRRTALERVGGWRDPLPSQHGYEDWNLWMDLAQAGERVVHLGEVIYRRRMHSPGWIYRPADGTPRSTARCGRGTRTCSSDRVSTGGAARSRRCARSSIQRSTVSAGCCATRSSRSRCSTGSGSGRRSASGGVVLRAGRAGCPSVIAPAP